MKPYRMHLMLCAGTGCVSNKSFHIAEVFEKELEGAGEAQSAR
jgi:NADH:ubiquinone oxidoreductase subunit E